MSCKKTFKNASQVKGCRYTRNIFIPATDDEIKNAKVVKMTAVYIYCARSEILNIFVLSPINHQKKKTSLVFILKGKNELNTIENV